MASNNAEKTLSDMLAQLRQKKKLSYDDISERGTIPAQLVEDIEKGLVCPSIGALKKITKALGIPLAEFFQQAGLSEKEIQALESCKDTVHIKRDKREALRVKGSKAEIQFLTPNKIDHNIELLWQEVDGKSSGGDWLTHEGEECCFVFKGSIRLHIEDQVYELEEGDSIWFKTSQKHKWDNPSDKPAVLLWAITPPYHGTV